MTAYLRHLLSAYKSKLRIAAPSPHPSNMESSDSKSIRKAIWSGSIPCKILLDPGECRVFDDSDPYYARIPPPSHSPIAWPGFLCWHYGPLLSSLFREYLIYHSLFRKSTSSSNISWLIKKSRKRRLLGLSLKAFLSNGFSHSYSSPYHSNMVELAISLTWFYKM